MPEAYVFDAVRTPRGRGKASGSLNVVHPVKLLTTVLDALAERNELDTSQVDDVVVGCVTQTGDQGQCVARTATLLSDYDLDVPGHTVNRFCGSGLEAVNQAACMVGSGFYDLVLAGGVESMSRVKMGSDGGAMFDPFVQWSVGAVPQGISADLMATLWGLSRDDVDAFAVRSQQNAAAAREAGHFAKSLVTVRDESGLPVLDHDEFVRPDTTAAGLAKLKPSFAMMGEQFGVDTLVRRKYPQVERITHVHHAGNSSGIVDGAAMVAIGTKEKGESLGLKPRARIRSMAVVGEEPIIMLTGPIPATRRALEKAGMTVGDIDLFEVNEAFAAVPLVWQRELGVDLDKLNVNGGAIALGHPLGATGAVLFNTVLDELERRDLNTGLVTLCIGGGMGIGTILERV